MMLVILVAWNMPATSTTSDGEYFEGFRGSGIGAWVDVQGNISLADSGEAPRMAHPTIETSYLILEDDGLAGRSRTRLNHSAIDDTLTEVRAEIIMQRDSEYMTPGNIAMTFGEANNTDAFYAAVFNDDLFILANFSSTDGAANIIHSQTGWGEVPLRSDQQTQLPATVDEAHRYTIEIQDAKNLTVLVDGWRVYNTTLPTAANGTIGVLAAPETKVWIQQVSYAVLDTTAPGIVIDHPEAGNQYVFDVTVSGVDTGMIPVIGDLTIEMHLEDDQSIALVHVFLDGRLLTDAAAQDLETGTHQYVLKTHDLELGDHTITVSAQDDAGNEATESVGIYVLPTVADTGPVSDTVRSLF